MPLPGHTLILNVTHPKKVCQSFAWVTLGMSGYEGTGTRVKTPADEELLRILNLEINFFF